MDWELVKPWVNRVGVVLEFLSFWLAAPEIVTEIRRDEGEWLRALERRVERGIRVLPTVLVLVTVVGFAGSVLLYMGERANVLSVPPEGRSALETVGFITGLNLATVTTILFQSSPFVSVSSRAEGERLTEGARRLLGGFDRWLWMLLGSYHVIRLARLAWRANAWVWLGGALLAALALALEVVLLIKQPSRALVWAAMAVMVTGVMVALMWAGVGTGWVNRLLALAMVPVPWIMLHERIFPPLLRTLADDRRIRQRSLAVGAVLFVVGFLLQLIATF